MLAALALHALLPLIGAAATDPAPWLPPFGLERVGAVQTSGANAFQAEAIADAGKPRNPVDLGCIFPAAGTLLLRPSDRGVVHLAALSPSKDLPDVAASTWLASQPDKRVTTTRAFTAGERIEISLPIPDPAFTTDRDTIEVSLADATGAELWHKQIPLMLIAHAPDWPSFGASETLLRYDLPISIRDPKTGALSTLSYDKGFRPELHDVVVSLPNGSRFVFWRGSSYIPFWAGARNTALCYEWAEMISQPKDAVDCIEPLMDKELRYAHVDIVESTPERVHVRWAYQSCDFDYKVWGDSAQEDYYFYPDGYGARVLTLTCSPEAEYEVSEFIVLAPALAYPLSFLPKDPIRYVTLDGTPGSVPNPFTAETLPKGPDAPLLYRVQLNKDAPETALYFNPLDKHRPDELVVFRPFNEQGKQVTPAYWGSHWPLARGGTTGGAIDDRIAISPSHNSLMSWAKQRPEPFHDVTTEQKDTLGQKRPMRTRQWAWLIALTNAPDAEVLEHAKKFTPPMP